MNDADRPLIFETLLWHIVQLHPLPWRVDHDWGYDVLAADGARIALFPCVADAEALILEAYRVYDGVSALLEPTS